MRALTPRQLEIVDFVRNYSAKHGYPPSTQEIAVMLDVVSTGGVHQHLLAIRRKGAITWEPQKVRSLRVVDAVPEPPASTPPSSPPPQPLDPWQMPKVDVYARVRGLPDPFPPHLLVEQLVVERRLFAFGANLFGLRLSSDAFTGCGLLPGDVVVFDRRPVRSGDLALVSFGADSILRNVWEKADGVELTITGSTAPTIFIRSPDWSPELVMGVAVGMVRRVAPAAAA